MPAHKHSVVDTRFVVCVDVCVGLSVSLVFFLSQPLGRTAAKYTGICIDAFLRKVFFWQ